MKKSVKVLALALVAVMICLSLAACGKTLKGKYSADFLGTGTTMTFDGNKVELAVTVATIEVASIDGTYKIDGEKISFDFIDEEDVTNDKAKAVIEKFEEPVSFEEGEDYIKVAGVKYELVEEKK